MKISIARAELLKGLHLAQRIADDWKNTFPILANVLIRSDGPDRVLCAATDLNVTCVAHLPAKVEKEGGLTVNVKQLYKIVKGLSNEDIITITGDDGPVRAELRSGRAEFKVVGMADRDFPKLPPIAEAQTFKVDAPALRQMIDRTIFSVSMDETRQYMSGVLFESDGATARMVSTDGHRLSKAGRPLPGGPHLATGILIPRKGVVEIRRAIETRKGACEIGVHQGNFVLRVDDVSLAVKLSDAQFPPYDQVIPKENDHFVLLPRSGFVEAIRRVTIMASAKTASVRLKFGIDTLSIESTKDASHEELAVAYKGPGVTIGLSARYLIDALGAIESTDVKIYVADSLTPVAIVPTDGSDYIGVIMPIKL